MTQERTQEGFLFALLWVTTTSSLLWKLTDEAFKPICYTDDPMMVLRGNDPCELCRKIEKVLNLAYDWA